jgi:hypothetical protein
MSEKLLTASKALDLISSLGQMRNYPTGNMHAIKRLVDALMLKGKEPVEEAIAVAVVDSFAESADSETPCPMERDIISAICGRLEEHRPNPDCLLCRGMGEIIKQYRDRNGVEFSGASRCTCWARRPAPVWEKAPDNPPSDIAEGIVEAVKRRVQ